MALKEVDPRGEDGATYARNLETTHFYNRAYLILLEENPTEAAALKTLAGDFGRTLEGPTPSVC